MRSLPDALAPLAVYRQFMLYKIVPSTTRPGKTDKFPVDYRTGAVANAHDPAIWMDIETAIQQCERWHADGIGFVFTEQDPFWFTDIDGAWDGTAWSPVAQQLCAMFAGCAVEVSTSGTGLHLFGSGTVPPHGTRLKAHGLEFYTSGRFVALTGIQASGNPLTDFSALMPSFVAQWFPPGAGEHAPSMDWTTEPCAEWRGPVDDDDLIRRALLSSGLSAFRGRAAFADLWQCNTDILAATYAPDPNSSEPYGASEADSGLASHLLFWTGKNCERTRQLMLRSALVRSKWDREDYLERTILRAAGVVAKVCVDKSVQTVEASAAAAPIDSRTYIPSRELAQVFAGCVYIQDNNGVLLPTGDIVDQQRFNAKFGGLTICLDPEDTKIAKHPWDAYLNNRVVRLPRVEATCFRPDLSFQELVETQGRASVNVYKKPIVARHPGDAKPYLDHIRKLLPHGDDALIFISYMQFLVQHPGYKARWAPFLQGTEGNGKGLLLEILIRALGDKYVFMIGPDMVANGFNAWAENNVLLVADDIFRSDNQKTLMDGLRRYITEKRHPVTYKGIDATNKHICGNWLFLDNHPDLMQITDKTRRICPLYCAQQNSDQLIESGLTQEYFNNYFIPWLESGGYEIAAEYLHATPIDPRYNPASACQRAPLTSSTSLAILDGRNGFEQDVTDWIETNEPGFCGGFISVTMLKRRLDHPPSPVRLRQMLGNLGYISAGRTARKVHPDEAQPTIYVKSGLVVADLAANYEAAQLQGVWK